MRKHVVGGNITVTPEYREKDSPNQCAEWAVPLVIVTILGTVSVRFAVRLVRAVKSLGQDKNLPST